jgi:hypothetical protein
MASAPSLKSVLEDLLRTKKLEAERPPLRGEDARPRPVTTGISALDNVILGFPRGQPEISGPLLRAAPACPALSGASHPQRLTRLDRPTRPFDPSRPKFIDRCGCGRSRRKPSPPGTRRVGMFGPSLDGAASPRRAAALRSAWIRCSAAQRHALALLLLARALACGPLGVRLDLRCARPLIGRRTGTLAARPDGRGGRGRRAPNAWRSRCTPQIKMWRLLLHGARFPGARSPIWRVATRRASRLRATPVLWVHGLGRAAPRNGAGARHLDAARGRRSRGRASRTRTRVASARARRASIVAPERGRAASAVTASAAGAGSDRRSSRARVFVGDAGRCRRAALERLGAEGPPLTLGAAKTRHRSCRRRCQGVRDAARDRMAGRRSRPSSFLDAACWSRCALAHGAAGRRR